MNLLEQIVIQTYEDVCKKSKNIPNIEHIRTELMRKNGIEDDEFHEYFNQLREVLDKLDLTYEESGEIKNPVIREVW